MRAQRDDFEGEGSAVESREILFRELADRDHLVRQLRCGSEQDAGVRTAEVVAPNDDDVEVREREPAAEPHHAVELCPGKNLGRFEHEVEPGVSVPLSIVESVTRQLVRKEPPGRL